MTSSMKFTKEAARDIYLSVKIVKRTTNVRDEVSEDVKINIWSKVKLFYSSRQIPFYPLFNIRKIFVSEI